MMGIYKEVSLLADLNPFFFQTPSIQHFACTSKLVDWVMLGLWVKECISLFILERDQRGG